MVLYGEVMTEPSDMSVQTNYIICVDRQSRFCTIEFWRCVMRFEICDEMPRQPSALRRPKCIWAQHPRFTCGERPVSKELLPTTLTSSHFYNSFRMQRSLRLHIIACEGSNPCTLKQVLTMVPKDIQYTGSSLGSFGMKKESAGIVQLLRAPLDSASNQ